MIFPRYFSIIRSKKYISFSWNGTRFRKERTEEETVRNSFENSSLFAFSSISFLSYLVNAYIEDTAGRVYEYWPRWRTSCFRSNRCKYVDPYHCTRVYIYKYKTNIPKFFQIFFEKKKKKIIAKIIKRSKLSTKDAKNIFFFLPFSLFSLIHVTTQ